MKIKNHYSQYGFTLVEIAIVLVILGFVLGALLLPLQAQREQAALAQTNITLENAKLALLGFAQQNGRLPCPATNAGTATFPDDTGTANPNASGACAQQVGFLPAVTLGIQSTDQQGFAIDAWNNRIRYAVTQSNSGGAATPDFTTNIADNPATPLVNEADGMNVTGIVNLAPNLRICAASGAANCTATINLINNAVALIYSTGPSGSQVIGGPDETENLNAVGAGQVDTVFVSHGITQTAPPNEFDHLVTWISPFVLYNAMIQAGQLH